MERRMTSWGSVCSDRSLVREEMGNLPSPNGSMYEARVNSRKASDDTPRRAKTATFFEGAFGGLTPPPNPPSRSNSLKEKPRSWLSSSPVQDSLIPPVPQIAPAYSALPSEKQERFVSAMQPKLFLSTEFDIPTSRQYSEACAFMSQLPSALEESHPLRHRFFSSPPNLSPKTLSPSSPSLPVPIDLAEDSEDTSRTPTITEHGISESTPPPAVGEVIGGYEVLKNLGTGSFSHVELARRLDQDSTKGPVVALKLVPGIAPDINDRRTVSIVREVEILERVRHPSIISLIESFATPSYTVLVLEYATGGELFDFIANWHSSITHALARRIFGELCQAVGWMHNMFLVHRDIKLENILLTYSPFPANAPEDTIASLPTPFVKLTDFGLSRFISPSKPLLTTRCGSEAYAAPELIMGKPYDGRQTDVWALGVVLYCLITSSMPFNEDEHRSRKSYLMKIAKAEYHWPENTSDSNPDLKPDDPIPRACSRLVTEPVKQLVGKLLRRDPMKRALVQDLWKDEWLMGEGCPIKVKVITS